ncbi:MAG TPA: hypothetical protein VML55_08240, partial [Planctomycetaceae bacterium]|nr:hypothetical protein [Planctomycetaceae bacterium]
LPQELTAAVRHAVLTRDLRMVELETVEPSAGDRDQRWQARIKPKAPKEGDTSEPQSPVVLYDAASQADAAVFNDTLAAVTAGITKRVKRWEMFGMFLVTTGGGLGLVLFGPFSEWLGRRGAFLLYHVGGLVAALVTFQFLAGWQVWLAALPLFGFLTLGMHAGYAIYFPELFPTRLRGTGAGFCFNVGRVLAAPILFVGGWMQRDWGYSLENAASLLSLLFLAGALLLVFAPETKGTELPE